MGKAIGIAADEMPGTAERVCRLRNMLIHMILDRICDVKLNGHPEKRLPNNCHLSFAGIDSEALLLRMDLEGIAVSGGSACTSGSVEPSHVLQAIGLSDEYRKGSIRLTLGRETTEQEMIETAETITRIVTDLRSMCGR
jgi:cysteine desulfurase